MREHPKLHLPDPAAFVLGPEDPDAVGDRWKVEVFRDWWYSLQSQGELWLWMEKQLVPLRVSKLSGFPLIQATSWSMTIASQKQFVTVISQFAVGTKPFSWLDLGFTVWHLVPQCLPADHVHNYRWSAVVGGTRQPLPDPGTNAAFELQVQLLDGNHLWIVPPESVGMQAAPGSLTLACFPGAQPFEVQLECSCLQFDQGEDALSLAMVLSDFSGFKENTVKDKGEFVWAEEGSPLPTPKEMTMEQVLTELERSREAAPFSRLLGFRKRG